MKKVLLLMFAAVALMACEKKPDESGKPTGMAFDRDAITMSHSEIDRLRLTFTPEGTSAGNITYTSSNDTIVEVDANGNITASSYLAVDGHTATITATTNDSQDGSTLTATCEITVVNAHRNIEFYGWYAPWSDPEPTGKLVNLEYEGDSIQGEVYRGTYFGFSRGNGIVEVPNRPGYVQLQIADGDYVLVTDIYYVFAQIDPDDSTSRVNFILGQHDFMSGDTVSEDNPPATGMIAGTFDETAFRAALNGGTAPWADGAWFGPVEFSTDGATWGTSYDSRILAGSFVVLGNTQDSQMATNLYEDFDLMAAAFYPQDDGQGGVGTIYWQGFEYTPEGVTDLELTEDGNLPEQESVSAKAASSMKPMPAGECQYRNDLLRTLNYPVAMRMDDVVKMRECR